MENYQNNNTFFIILENSNDFHAEMIRQAAAGKLSVFLLPSQKKSICQIISKKFDRKKQEHVFVIETADNQTISRTAREISSDKKLLSTMEYEDIFDIGFTQGSESVLNEKIATIAKPS